MDDRTVTGLETTALDALRRYLNDEPTEGKAGAAVAAVRELARRAVAAEADRDRLQAELDRHKDMEAVAGAREFDVTQERDRYRAEAQTLRDALEQIAAMNGYPHTSVAKIARAALATPEETT